VISAITSSLALMLCLASLTQAQSPTDSATRRDDGPTRAWLSVGLGAGNSNGGPIAGRAAASLAVNRVLVFTLAATSVGGLERSVSSTNLLVGVQTSDPKQFVFLSAGWAKATCGNACEGATGIAIDGGFHIGWRYAGVGLVGFAVQAPGRNYSSGVVVSIDAGWFGRRRVSNQSAGEQRG
jgi:hypothetical protein